MPPAHLPATGGPGQPGPRSPASTPSAVETFRAPAPDIHRADPPSAPVFAAGGFEFGTHRTSDECWRMLDPAIRARLEERAGRIQAWWASSESDERIKAVAFGSLGLCIAEPMTRADGSRSYSVNTYVIDPATVRRKTIEHRPGAHDISSRPSAGSSSRTSPADEDPPYGAPPGSGLGSREREVLGNLPPLAQQLVQEPFVRGEKILRVDWHYEGTATALSALTFVLAGPRTVTVVAGRMNIPPGHGPETAHWSLVCHRAEVVRRIGR